MVSWWREEQVRRNCSGPVFGQSCTPLIVLIPHKEELVSLSYGRSQEGPSSFSSSSAIQHFGAGLIMTYGTVHVEYYSDFKHTDGQVSIYHIDIR